ANGQPISNPIRPLTSYSYDALHRKTEQIEAYDVDGQRTTLYRYDAADDLLSVSAPGDYDQEDEFGLLVPSAARITTTYDNYDALGQSGSKTEAVGLYEQRQTTFVYDARGHVIDQTAGIARDRNYAFPLQTRFLFDALGRNTEIDQQYVQMGLGIPLF